MYQSLPERASKTASWLLLTPGMLTESQPPLTPTVEVAGCVTGAPAVRVAEPTGDARVQPSSRVLMPFGAVCCHTHVTGSDRPTVPLAVVTTIGLSRSKNCCWSSWSWTPALTLEPIETADRSLAVSRDGRETSTPVCVTELLYGE